VTSTNIPAAVYGRISQDPEFTFSGVDRHMRLCLRRIQETSSWTLAPLPGSWRDPRDHDAGRWPDGVLIDNNISAASAKTRPEYDRLMAAVDAGEVKIIVAYNQARLWRNRIQRADGFGRLAKAKVRLEFIKGASYDFKDATSRMVAGIIGETDEWFAQITSENQRATMADHAERGAYHGRRPFGFDRIGAPGEKRGAERTLVANDKEARYLRRMYEMADPQGQNASLWEIAKWLDAEGVLSPTGMSWCEAGTSSLSLILTAPRNIGMRAHSEGWSGSGHRPPLDVEGGTTKLHPGNWHGIVDEDLFWRVREKYTDPKRRRPGPKTEGKHLLTGLVWCGACGGPMWVAHNRTKPAYTCARCHTVRAKDAVESKTLRIVFLWMSENGPYDRAMEATEPADLAALRITLKGLRSKRQDILNDYYDDKITKDDRDHQLARKDAQIAEIKAKLDEFDRQIRSSTAARGDIFAQQWQQWAHEGAAGMLKQRRFLEGVIGRVVVYKAGRTNRPSPRLIVVEPGEWARRLDDPAEVAPPAPPDAITLTPRGRVVDVLKAAPGRWLSRHEIADATGRGSQHPVILDTLLKRMLADGVVERQWCRLGTAVENGNVSPERAAAQHKGDMRGVGCYGWRLPCAEPVVEWSRTCPVCGRAYDLAGDYCSANCRSKDYYRKHRKTLLAKAKRRRDQHGAAAREVVREAS
jgi:DNA invertase Pin-like site-specific DNA recombinase